MKTKNKIRINATIAAFIAIFAAGTVFALVAERPLEFNGRVNLEMGLIVGIDFADWNLATGNPLAVQLDMPMFSNYIPGLGGLLPSPWGFGKTAYLHLTFTQPTTAAMTYWIENLGTMDAMVYVELWDNGGNPYIDVTTSFVAPQILAPGQRVQVLFLIEAKMPYGANFVQETAEFELILHYERTN